MVVFELATTDRETWKVHLDAAFAMFTKLIPEPSLWSSTLLSLYTTRWPPPEMGLRRPWSTDQAALRFYTAQLVLMDVMSSAALERAPRLQTYHDITIPCLFSRECRLSATTVGGSIFMDEFVGLHNWIVQVIGDVASLDAWRKDQRAKNANHVCPDELKSRAGDLLDSINRTLPALEEQMRTTEQSHPTSLSNIVQDPFPGLESIITGDFQGFHPSVASHNALWLRATLIYLYTVLLGWQPNHPDIQPHVSKLTHHINTLPESSCLRGLA
jgi:C6 transcription factor Pro1